MLSFPHIPGKVGQGHDEENSETFQLPATPESQGKSKAWGNLKSLGSAPTLRCRPSPLPECN